jgi:hypothetical protein
MFIFKITNYFANEFIRYGSFFKYDKTFASDLYLIYKLSPSAGVCMYIRYRSAAHVLSSTYTVLRKHVFIMVLERFRFDFHYRYLSLA